MKIMYVHIVAEIVYRFESAVPGSQDNEECDNSCFQKRQLAPYFDVGSRMRVSNIFCLVLNS